MWKGSAAFTLIKAGVESGNIKLMGNTTSSTDQAKKAAAADAAYLLELFTKLTAPGKQDD